MTERFDVVIIGAGAAGLMCAVSAGRRGRTVLMVDHAPKLAEKIRISGGGRCNFTNLHTTPEAFLSANPHFCKSALRQFDQYDFIAMVEAHKIAYHEKSLVSCFVTAHHTQSLICSVMNVCKIMSRSAFIPRLCR